MLVNFDATGRIIWYNLILSKEEATEYISDNTIWIDGSMPDVKNREGYYSVFFINEDRKTIRVEYEPIPIQEPTTEEKILMAVEKSQDEVRQEGADMVMEELLKRGMIV